MNITIKYLPGDKTEIFEFDENMTMRQFMIFLNDKMRPGVLNTNTSIDGDTFVWLLFDKQVLINKFENRNDPVKNHIKNNGTLYAMLSMIGYCGCEHNLSP